MHTFPPLYCYTSYSHTTSDNRYRYNNLMEDLIPLERNIALKQRVGIITLYWQFPCKTVSKYKIFMLVFKCNRIIFNTLIISSKYISVDCVCLKYFNSKSFPNYCNNDDGIM